MPARKKPATIKRKRTTSSVVSSRRTKPKKLRYGARKGPAQSATLYNLGTRKRGNDGRMWKVIRSGVSRRWVRVE